MPSVSRNNPAPQPPGGALALSTAWPPWSRCNWRLLISEIVLAPRWSPSSSWLKVLNSPPSQLLPLHAAAERFCTLSVLSTFVIFLFYVCLFDLRFGTTVVSIIIMTGGAQLTSLSTASPECCCWEVPHTVSVVNFCYLYVCLIWGYNPGFIIFFPASFFTCIWTFKSLWIFLFVNECLLLTKIQIHVLKTLYEKGWK